MSVISLRLNEKEENLLKEVATFEGLRLSTYLKKIIFERLEDEYDLKLAEKSYQEYLDSGKKSHSFKEVLAELGLEDDI